MKSLLVMKTRKYSWSSAYYRLSIFSVIQ